MCRITHLSRCRRAIDASARNTIIVCAHPLCRPRSERERERERERETETAHSHAHAHTHTLTHTHPKTYCLCTSDAVCTLVRYTDIYRERDISARADRQIDRHTHTHTHTHIHPHTHTHTLPHTFFVLRVG